MSLSILFINIHKIVYISICNETTIIIFTYCMYISSIFRFNYCTFFF